MTTRVSIIAAVASNRVIGADNALPWHVPEDLKRFRALTMGHHIIMGRKTYESLGRLLPGRTTVIITRQQGYAVEGAKIAHSLAEALAACGTDEEVFIIGGEEIYRQALPMADRLLLTEVEGEFPGDAWFPAYEAADWREVSRERFVSSSGLACSYVEYSRVNL